MKRIDPADAQRVAAEARRVLKGNRQSGISDCDGMRYDFVCPSPTHRERRLERFPILVRCGVVFAPLRFVFGRSMALRLRRDVFRRSTS
jgi:hypothetical protein